MACRDNTASLSLQRDQRGSVSRHVPVCSSTPFLLWGRRHVGHPLSHCLLPPLGAAARGGGADKRRGLLLLVSVDFSVKIY
jgi:hypothetical protein